MKYIIVFLGLLLGYTLIYAGASKYWPTLGVAPIA